MSQWKYDTSPDIDKSYVDRLRNFPREPDILTYSIRSASALTVRSFLKLFHGLSIHGREHLPRDQSFMMVANHSSHLDVLCMLAALPFNKLHRAFPAAAADYFFVNIPRTAVAAMVVNAFPFQRQKCSRGSLRICEELLTTPGNILILFPEGTRTNDGTMGPFKPGIGQMLTGKSFPVLPCYLKGAYQAWPKRSKFPKPGKLSLHIGPARSFESLPKGKASWLKIAADLRNDVVALAAGAGDTIAPLAAPAAETEDS